MAINMVYTCIYIYIDNNMDLPQKGEYLYVILIIWQQAGVLFSIFVRMIFPSYCHSYGEPPHASCNKIILVG